MASRSKSKSIRARPRNPKLKIKQQWQVKKPLPNWLELPSDVTANILHRLGAVDIIENAQKVCMTWRNICKDPAMWRVIDIQNLGDISCMPYDLEKMCMHAVDRSQGQLVDINIEYFGTDELLHYIADRSSQLRRLQLACLYGSVFDTLSEVLPKFPLLEELTICLTDISKKDIEAAGRYCSLLKTLKINQKGSRLRDMEDENVQELQDEYNKEVIAIGKSLPKLRHLQLIGNSMSNVGLQAILDSCTHLESLDLRSCPNINLDGDLGKRCSQQIKFLRLPGDSMEDYKFAAGICDWDLSDDDYAYSGDYGGYSDWDDEYAYSDCDDFLHYNLFNSDGEFTQFEDLNDWENFKAMWFYHFLDNL